MEQNQNALLDKEEKFRRKCLEKIKQFRLMDDDFFRVCFQDDLEGATFILRIIMEKDDLTVTEVKSQHYLKNLQGHSVILDVFATDSQGARYDIEVQRADKGAAAKRARYNSSMIDAQQLLPEEEYTVLPESYVIFITENDVLKKGLPIYHIDRVINETGERFQDGSHIIYANAAYIDDSALGKLMHDFNCADPSEMKYSFLAEKTRLFKEDTKGVTRMSKLMEDFVAEIVAEERAEIKAEAEIEARTKAKELAIKSTLRMIKGGKLTLEEISEYTMLPLEEVKEYAALTAN